MRKRFHCEFKECKCSKFTLHCNNLCFICGHSKIWHSTKSKPPTDEYLSFVSSRKSARKPSYSYVSPIQIAVFIPEATAQPLNIIEVNRYCPNVELLPI